MFRWTTPAAPTNRAGGAPPRGPEYAAVAAGREVFAFGGGGGGGLCDDDDDRIHVHVFNTVSLRWRKLPFPPRAPPGGGEVPPYLTGHTAALVERTVYFLGECGYPYRNVLHAFDVDAAASRPNGDDGRRRRWWSKPGVSGAVPAASYDHSACVLGHVMLVYGGRTWLTGYIMDNGILHRLDTTTMTWSLIRAAGTPPPVSDCHSATVVGTRMLVCGTTSWNHRGAVVRAFDTETDAWLSAPPSRSSPGGEAAAAQRLPKRPCLRATFARGGALYMFGDYAKDLWRLDGETLDWRRVEPKGAGPRPMFLSRCCLAGDLVVLFGSRTNVVLDLSPSLKTLCKLAVIQHGLERSGLPHDIRWELEALRPATETYGDD